MHKYDNNASQLAHARRRLAEPLMICIYELYRTYHIRHVRRTFVVARRRMAVGVLSNSYIQFAVYTDITISYYKSIYRDSRGARRESSTMRCAMPFECHHRFTPTSNYDAESRRGRRSANRPTRVLLYCSLYADGTPLRTRLPVPVPRTGKRYISGMYTDHSVPDALSDSPIRTAERWCPSAEPLALLTLTV